VSRHNDSILCVICIQFLYSLTSVLVKSAVSSLMATLSSACKRSFWKHRAHNTYYIIQSQQLTEWFDQICCAVKCFWLINCQYRMNFWGFWECLGLHQKGQIVSLLEITIHLWCSYCIIHNARIVSRCPFSLNAVTLTGDFLCDRHGSSTLCFQFWYATHWLLMMWLVSFCKVTIVSLGT
jgi:hypothetical protein